MAEEDVTEDEGTEDEGTLEERAAVSQLSALVLLVEQGNEIIKRLWGIQIVLLFLLGFVSALFTQALVR